MSAQFIVAGVGLLSSTNYPNIVGRDSFAGRSYHTSRWPHEGVDLRTKRVGVIGSGSSGVQLITEIAPQVDELFVFQRRPQYTVPARHSPIPRDALEAINADYEDYWEGVLQSVTAFGFPESPVPAMSVSAEERDARVRGGLEDRRRVPLHVRHVQRHRGRRAGERGGRRLHPAQDRPHREGPEAGRVAHPVELYARRPLCNDDYYETYNRDNVNLVDLRDEPIEEITPTGIRTAARDYDLDVIVYATGFDAVTGNYVKIDMRGRDGEQLREKWIDGPRCHLGIVTNGFPNMFMIFGPMGPFTNQPPAHEFQVNWIADAIAYVRDNDLGTIEPTLEAEDAWMDECVEIASGTLFPRVDSWINGSNVDGKAVSVNFYMAGMGAYVERMRAIAANDYDGFAVGASA